MLCVLGSQEKWLAKAEASAYLCSDPESVSKKGKTKVGWDVGVCLVLSYHPDLKQ